MPKVPDILQTRSVAPSYASMGQATRLVVLHTPDPHAIDRPVLLDSHPVVIGREGHAIGALALRDGQLSREHARFERVDGSWSVIDLDSHNGTWVDGRRIRDAALVHGDVVRCGTTLLLFEQIEIEADAVLEPETDTLRGPSVAMSRVRGEIGLIAPRSTAVLILGDSGVGKELVASELHRRSGRPGECVPVNCAAIPDNLLESELFGHVSGAFTGATQGREGLFVQAEGGTIFLDEVGELPLKLQAKLLRVLATGEVRAVGSNELRHVDVRVVAATNQDLDERVDEGLFRGDLFARLSGWTIHVPPLAERRADILPLARFFLSRNGAGLPIRASAAEALLLHPWPYNVRELEQAMAEATVRAASAPELRTQHLPKKLRSAGSQHHAPAPLALRVRRTGTPSAADLVLVFEHFEGNVAQAAEFFDKERRQVYRWARRHGLNPDDYR